MIPSDRDIVENPSLNSKNYFRIMQRSLAYLTVALVVFCIASLVFFKISDESRDIFYMIMGAILAKYGSVIDYFFGSSSGSAQKSENLKVK